MKDLKDRIIAIKAKFNINNSMLAKIAGVSDQAISDIVNGKTTDPKISIMGRISKEFNINLRWLINGEGEMTVSEADSKEIQAISEENSKLEKEVLDLLKENRELQKEIRELRNNPNLR